MTDLKVINIKGENIIERFGCCYRFSHDAISGNKVYKCFTNDCLGAIVVKRRIKPDKSGGLYKFIAVKSIHDNSDFCSRQYKKLLAVLTDANSLKNTTKTLNLTSNYNETIYENCIDKSVITEEPQNYNIALLNDSNDDSKDTTIIREWDWIEPADEIQDSFVQLKSEVDIINQKFLTEYKHDTVKINKILIQMTLLLNNKCKEAEAQEKINQVLVERIKVAIENNKSIQEKQQMTEDRIKVLIAENDEQEKLNKQVQKQQNETISTLRQQLEEIRKENNTSTKKTITSQEKSENNLQNQHQHNQQQQHHKQPHQQQQQKQTMSEKSNTQYFSPEKTVLGTMNLATKSNPCPSNSEQDNFVTVSKYLELEQKVRVMNNDIQGLKIEIIKSRLRPQFSQPQQKRDENAGVPTKSSPPMNTDHRNQDDESRINQADVFIIGDGHARNIKETIQSRLPTTWCIQQSFDVKANLKTVSEKCIQKIDKCKHLIVMAGSNDICMSAKKDMLSSLKKILEKYAQSNMIHLVLIPDRYDDTRLNLHINNVNEQILEFVKPYKNVKTYNPRTILSSWDYYDSFFVGRQGKIKIGNEIVKNILTPVTSTLNHDISISTPENLRQVGNTEANTQKTPKVTFNTTTSEHSGKKANENGRAQNQNSKFHYINRGNNYHYRLTHNTDHSKYNRFSRANAHRNSVSTNNYDYTQARIFLNRNYRGFNYQSNEQNHNRQTRQFNKNNNNLYLTRSFQDDPIIITCSNDRFKNKTRNFY